MTFINLYIFCSLFTVAARLAQYSQYLFSFLISRIRSILLWLIKYNWVQMENSVIPKIKLNACVFQWCQWFYICRSWLSKLLPFSSRCCLHSSISSCSQTLPFMACATTTSNCLCMGNAVALRQTSVDVSSICGFQFLKKCLQLQLVPLY